MIIIIIIIWHANTTRVSHFRCQIWRTSIHRNSLIIGVHGAFVSLIICVWLHRVKQRVTCIICLGWSFGKTSLLQKPSGRQSRRDKSESAVEKRHWTSPRRLVVYLLRGVGGRRRPRLGGLFGIRFIALRRFRGEQDGTPSQRRAGGLQIGEEGICEGGREKKLMQQREHRDESRVRFTS